MKSNFAFHPLGAYESAVGPGDGEAAAVAESALPPEDWSDGSEPGVVAQYSPLCTSKPPCHPVKLFNPFLYPASLLLQPPNMENTYMYQPPGCGQISFRRTAEDHCALLRSAVDSKLPHEILEVIAEDAAGTKVHASIIEKWTPIETNAGQTLSWDSLGNFAPYRQNVALPLEGLAFSRPRRSFFLRDDPRFSLTPDVRSMADLTPEMVRAMVDYEVARDSTDCLYRVFSSADLLYRMRCIFPSVAIYTPSDAYKYVHSAGILHKGTGFGLAVTEWKGAAHFRILWLDRHSINGSGGLSQQSRLDTKRFSLDVVELCNLMFATDNEGRFAYYHPSAFAVAPPKNHREFTQSPITHF
jgi:hypothetical protein